MTFYANALQSITVLDAEGGSKGTLSGKVVLKGGDGLRVTSDGNEIQLDAGQSYTDQNARYRRKYATIVGGGTFVDDDGSTQNYSGMPYYLASLNGIKGNFVNNFDFNSSPCGQVGIFKDDSLRPTGALELLDICQACVDCADYEQIIELMDRIEEFQDWDVKRNLNDTEEGGELALFHQYQAAIHYWNYLVHGQSIPFVVMRGSNRFFGINTGYFVKDCVDLTNVRQTIFIDTSWCDCDEAMSPEEKEDYEHGEITVRLTNWITRPDDLDGPVVTVTKLFEGDIIPWPDNPRLISFCHEGSVRIDIDYPDMSYNDYLFFQLTIRSDKPMCDTDVHSMWCNTHLTIPPGESEDPSGDQCISRTREDVT